MPGRGSVCNIDLDTELQNDSAPQNSKSRSDEADRLNSLSLDRESPAFRRGECQEEDMDILIEVNNLYQNPAIRAEVMNQFRDLLNKTLGILRSPRTSYEAKCRAGQEVAIRTIYLNQHYGPDFIESGSDERWKVDKIRLMAR